MKYLYDLTKLQYGDIILTRIPGNKISDKVREATNSEFSHALIYVEHSSYIEADKRVQARNLSRLLFDNTADTCVLRVKPEYLKPYTIDAAVYYARFVVGNPYAKTDALRMEYGITNRFTYDTQICTRLVAKAYEFSGLKIVENVEMCTPQELLESDYVEVHRDFLRMAKDFDLKFAATYDVIDDMVRSTEKLFDSVAKFDDGKIRNMKALTDYVSSHPEDDEEIAKLLEESGYLDVLNIEEKKNKYNYDKEKFIAFYGEDDAYMAAISAMEVNKKGLVRNQQECLDLERRYCDNGFPSRYLILLISLDKKIIGQHLKRIEVCKEVMNDPRT